MDDVIIGLEIHVQLNKLHSKMFCGCSTAYHDSEPNTHTCPVCLGLPGSLPVLNKKAVESGIKVGLALNCTIEEETLFYRKNYYYPDLPKGFQISQYDFPLATKGHIMILGDDGAERDIRINRAHMEEDPGRLVHAGTIDKAKYTMVDYNRCGMPLLEVVTEPDLCSPKEARVFLDKLKSILEYLDVFDGSLEGSMRVDANISLRGGDRTEVKNISGFKGVEKALSYEITRQKNMQRRNIKVVQETRHFDEIQEHHRLHQKQSGSPRLPLLPRVRSGADAHRFLGAGDKGCAAGAARLQAGEVRERVLSGGRPCQVPDLGDQGGQLL